MTREPFIAHSDLTNEIYIVVGKEKYRVTEQAIKAVMAIKALEQEPKTDVLDKIRAEIKALTPKPTVYDVVDGNPVKDAVWETLIDVLQIIDKYRECGKTAITRAENDEILNEAWHLLMSVTEEDGVSTGELNGMLKLMTFFFYKYHGLKKKPEWVENVEARIEESEENK